MSWKIRDFTDDDYEDMIAVQRAVYPDYPEAAADWRYWDGAKSEKIRWGYLVAEEGSDLLGVAVFSQSEWSYHPRKFSVLVMVHPAARGRGIGLDLYQKLMTRLAGWDAILVRSEVREDMDRERTWLEGLGFSYGHRNEESVLRFGSFTPELYTDAMAAVRAQGVEIHSFAELDKIDPETRRKYHDLDMEVARDVPCPDEFTPQTFETWSKTIFGSPNFIPELNLIAVDGDRYIGLSNMWSTEVPGRVETGLTGVRRPYRKRGLATALKVESLARAKRLGYDHTLTYNETGNAGMLGINARLGFERQPAWLDMELILDPAAVAAEQVGQGCPGTGETGQTDANIEEVKQ
jgi:mycothiol synthase